MDTMASPAQRFVLSTLGTGGDIIPFARLARELLRRGHSVTVHSWALYAEWFPGAARFVAAGGGPGAEELDETFAWALRAPAANEQARRFGRLFYGLGDGTERARAHHHTAREAFAGHDLAVINALDHVAQATAELQGLRWVGYTSRPPPDPIIADGAREEIDAAVTALVAAVTGNRRRVRVFREQSPLLTLVPCSPGLVTGLPPPLVAITGAWLEPPVPRPLAPAIESFLDEAPALLATFGTMPDVTGRTAALIAAAEKSGWRALIQVLPPAVVPAPVPPGIAIVRERIPFAVLLPRVAAVVHHGSVGTLHEVLAAGRPSFVIPHMGDQSYWAAALHRHGLGPAPVPCTALDPALIAARLIELRDVACAFRAREFGARMAAEDGVAFAAGRLETLAAARA